MLYLPVGDPNSAILESADGGDTWSVLSRQFQGEWPVGKILVDPTDTSGTTLYLFGGGAGLYRSTDGGTTWTPKVAGFLDPPGQFRVSDLDYTVDADNRLTLYAAVGYSGTGLIGIWSSVDGGDLWTRISLNLNDLAGAPVTDANIGKINLAMDHTPGTPHGVFAAIANKQTLNLMNVFKLDSDGRFSASGNGLRPINITSGQALGMAADGSLYVGGVYDSRQNGLYQSTDGGINWTSIDVGSNGLRPHTDIHCWAFYNGAVYAGNDGGIWRFTPRPNNQAGPGTWESLNTSSLQTILAQGACLHPTDPNTCLCGSQDNSIALLTKGTWIETGGDDNSRVLFDPDPNNGGKSAYYTGVSSYQFFWRSDDGGYTWSDKSPADAIKQQASIDWYAPFAIHPFDTRRIAVGIDRVYETRDRGDTWGTAISPVFSGAQSSAIAYSTNDIIWVAYDQALYFTPNAGGDGMSSNWQRVGDQINFGGKIVKILADPRFPETIYVSSDAGRVWRSPDNGNSWTDITGNLPSTQINTMTLIPARGFDDPYLFVGTTMGAYLSLAQGADLSWGVFNSGLPYANVKDLQLAASRSLVAAVYGRGVYTVNLANLSKPKITIRVPRTTDDFCDVPFACGQQLTLSFRVTGAINPTPYSIKWTIDNGQLAPGETGDQPTCNVVLPPVSGVTTVKIDLTFEDGYHVSARTTISCIPAEQVRVMVLLCKYVHSLQPHLPWPPRFPGDPPIRNFVTNPLTSREVHQLVSGLEELLAGIRRAWPDVGGIG